MLPSDRHQRILTLLEEYGSVHINELSQEFNVSEMTIHRDLANLEAQGQLRKVRGGAIPVSPPKIIDRDACFMCHTIPRGQTQVTLHMADGKIKHACCPHCGLHGLMMLGNQVSSVLVTDFLRGQAVNAQKAIYVVEAEVTICCTPTVIAFQKNVDANRFQKGFGGRVLSLTETTNYLENEMKLH